MKRTIIAALFALVAVSAFGQTDSTKVKKEKENRIAVNGTVADSFTKAAIPDVKVTLLRDDSTVVGTMHVWKMSSYSGVGQSVSTTNYHFLVSREPAKYILKFEHPNYETTFADYEMKKVGRRLQDVEGPKVYMKKAAKASHFEGGEIGEVEVKATKIKMVWKGDTLVYNADAFNVPEGSMLDGLIKQLPGVELKDNGEIFVNGKKIQNLTLNGADLTTNGSDHDIRYNGTENLTIALKGDNKASKIQYYPGTGSGRTDSFRKYRHFRIKRTG